MSVSAPTLDPTIDFLPLFADQTEEVILARMRGWANEGLDPVADAARWVDTREGGHWYTAVIPGVREIARLYDLAGSEVPMSAFVLWAWGAYLDDLAAAYNVQRKPATQAVGTETFTAPPGTVIALGTRVATIPTGPDDPAPTFDTTQSGTVGGGGTLNLAILASTAGQAGNVAAHAITAQSTPLPAVTALDNALATGGGTDVETDEDLRTRVLQAMAGQGGANVAAYIRWASQFAGVGAVKVVPTASGPNSVLVMITDPTGQPLPAGTVSGLQTDLDPVAGKGAGRAPVGAQATVATSTVLSVTVSATVTYQSGYSASGAGNTVALQTPIFNAIAAYLRSIQPGGVIRNAHVAGIIATWPGVENVSNVQLNGLAAGVDVNVGLSPPQAPQLTTLTI